MGWTPGWLGRARAAGALVPMLAWVAVACEPPVPEGFHEYTVFEGLTRPTAVELAPDGSIFVAEKRGVVKRFDGVDDETPTVVADLRTDVFSGWDRGLLDLALAPGFPAEESLYVLYTYDAPPGEVAPWWGRPGADDENCPDPPGWTDDGCVVTGRLSRLPLAGGRWTGVEHVLLHDWCQQYPSHSVGSLAFAPDGALYVSGGDGASFGPLDYGQLGEPTNPCGDPPEPVGGQPAPPSAEGGMLRSQDVRTAADPTGLNGAVLRIDPATGEALPDNPLAAEADPNARRIVAYGFRNPFRFTLRPGTDELWIGDVGAGTFEELDRSVGDDGTADNFGWPCYEGPGRMGSVDQLDLALCETLYAGGTAAVTALTAPAWTYRHDRDVTPDERCEREQGSSVSGVAFAPEDSAYPDRYDGALFVADGTRGCIWVMEPGSDGRPDPSTVAPFVTPAATPVELEIGPHGELWYVDHEGGTIRRIGYSDSNRPPVAAVRADPTAGDPPLTVTFDASRSSDPDAGDTLSYGWDLDNDGAFDDGEGAVVTTTFDDEGLKVARVRVTDRVGATAKGAAVVEVGQPWVPLPVIETPSDVVTLAVGEPVEYSGWATDADGRLLPAEALHWSADLLHCPHACHRHPGVFSRDGVLSGSFPLPDHEVPAALALHLTVRWEGEEATVSRRVEHRATELTLASEPDGVTLSAGGTTVPAPFTRPFATGGVVTLTAPATATIDGVPHAFAGWSDGGSRSHEVVVPADPATYTARYTPAG